RSANYRILLSCRRRHTRSTRDWSPDVCSSDLILPLTSDNSATALSGAFSADIHGHEDHWHIQNPHTELPVPDNRPEAPVSWKSRSEERRVGNDCIVALLEEAWTYEIGGMQ